jgi:hypothetical protein
MIDYKKYATIFSTTEEIVKAKVDEYRVKVTETVSKFYKDPDAINAKVEELVQSNISSLFSLPPYEYAMKQFKDGKINKYDCVVLAIAPTSDRNDFKAREHKGKWFTDAKSAVDEHWVREGISKDGKPYPIATYNEPTTKDSDGNEIPNPRFGKDMPYDGAKNLIMVVTGVGDDNVEELAKGFIRWDKKTCTHEPRVGKKSQIFGNKYGESYSISKDAYTDFGDYEKTFAMAMRILPTTELWKDLADVVTDAVPEYTKFAVKGNVTKVDDSASDKIKLRINSIDCPDGMMLSTKYVPLMEELDKLYTGDEVIVIGQKLSFTDKSNPDPRKVIYYQLWGVIKDNKDDDLMKELAEHNLVR